VTNFGQMTRAEIKERLKSRALDFPENHHEADLGCPVARNPAVGENLATAMPPVHGYLAHKKHPPPKDHHRSIGIWLL